MNNDKPAKQAELVAENQKLREYITAEREISQRFTDENAKLRSERDKMREALENLMNAYEDGGMQWISDAIEQAKSALSGGSKQ